MWLADLSNGRQTVLAARGLTQRFKALAQLVRGYRFTIVPVKLAAQEKSPGLAVVADLPMMSEIGLGKRLASDKTGQTSMQGMRQMLFCASGQRLRIQGLHTAIIGDTQRRGIGLPLPTEMGSQQGVKMFRIHFAQLQRC